MEMNGQISFADEEEIRQLRQYANAAEAVLFSFGRAVGLSEIARACGCDQKTAKEAMALLIERYEEMDTGLCIKEPDGKYRLCTKEEYYPNLINVLKLERKPVLSEVVMETLAIIAYKSPVTKAEIERIRGVKSDHAVNKLIEYGLVEETGRLSVPGRPALFAPTDEFYSRFDISNKADLPSPGPDVSAEIDEEVRAELKSFEESEGSQDKEETTEVGA